MPLHHDHHEPAQVALVLFCVGPYRAALEACHVLAMTDHPTTLRTANAQTLFYEGGDHDSPPSRWLTLRAAPTTSRENNSTWQLGVSGDITLQQFPNNTLYPLPKLLLSRRFSTALCGLTFDQQQLVLLLDARQLNPPLSQAPALSQPTTNS